MSDSCCPLCDSPLEGRDTMLQRIDSALHEVHARCETSTRVGEDRSGYQGNKAIGDSRYRLIPR